MEAAEYGLEDLTQREREPIRHYSRDSELDLLRELRKGMSRRWLGNGYGEVHLISVPAAAP